MHVLSNMLTDTQKGTLLKLKDGKLTPKQKADFYYRMSNILKKELEGLDDVLLLLEEIPDTYLEKISLQNTAAPAMKLATKILEKVGLPHVRRKGMPYKAKDVELEAVKSFDLGPFNKKYYFKDQDGETEIPTFGYSFTRGLTPDELNLIYEVTWHIDDLRSLLVPRRINLNDCSLEDFLNKVIPPLVEEANKKGVLHQVTIDNLGTVYPLEDIIQSVYQIHQSGKEKRET